MITIIIGVPGAGKTALLTHFLTEVYFSEGDELLEQSRFMIEEINERRTRKLTLPTKPPIYVDQNYDVKFLVGYEEYFTPYKVDAEKIGVPGLEGAAAYLFPCAKVFVPESQKFWNSRAKNIKPYQSHEFEMGRHWEIDFYLDLQRINLLDRNIKDLCKCFYEVRDMNHEYDDVGNIIRTIFHCRKFSDVIEVEKYTNGADNAIYEDVQIVHEGDIFDCYNSFSHADEFIPAEGEDFASD